MAKIVRVAVVGSGLAGLTAAYLLTNAPSDANVHFEVHLFEKTSSLGMDSSSISLPIPGTEQTWRVDVPMRSFQGGYYKQVIALYKKLGVAFVQRDFSYSFSLLSGSGQPEARTITTEMIYNGSSGLKGVSMPSKLQDSYLLNAMGLSGKAATSAWTVVVFVFWTIQLLLCYLRLIWLSLPFTRPADVETLTYAAWVRRTQPTNLLARWTGFDQAWADFTSAILIPLFSAICTASEMEIMEHPVEEMLDYIWVTLGTHHYVVKDGVRDVVSRLVSRVKHVHLSSLISSIETDPDDPDTVSVHCAGGVHSGFHHVVFATQANRCVPLLSTYADSIPSNQPTRRQAVREQIEHLKAFKYSSNLVINHTDESLLPDDTRDHRELNLIYTTDTVLPRKGTDSPRCVPSSYTMTTQILPRPPSFPAHLPSVYQTTNPTIEPKEGRILSVASLERAVLSLPSKNALRGLYRQERTRWGQKEDKLGPLQGAGSGPKIWICGSYAYPGIPLLEGCVVSARLVVEQGILQHEGVRVKRAPW